MKLTCAVLAALATLSAAAEAADPLPGCTNPYSVLCPMLEYSSPDAVVAENRGVAEGATQGLELQRMEEFVNLEQSKECRKRFRELQCRLMYPQCIGGDRPAIVPCRDTCLAYAKDCNVEYTSRCNAFPPSANCYNYKSAAWRAAGAPAVAALGAVLAYAGAFLL